MITIDKLQLKLNNKCFDSKSKRLFRISKDNFLIISKQIGKFINETNLQWNQTINLPKYGVDFDFQIYEQHNFGYNPQQMKSILHGRINVTSVSQRYGEWDVLNTNREKVGLLIANISNATNKSLVIIGSKKIKRYRILRINSIIAQIPELRSSRAYVKLSAGSKQVCTDVISSRTGQLVFIDSYELEIEQQLQQWTIEIYNYNAQGTTAIMIANGKINASQGTLPHKLQLHTLKDKKIVNVYVNGSIKDKNTQESNQEFSNRIKGVKTKLATQRRNQSVNNKMPNESKMVGQAILMNGRSSVLRKGKYYRGTSLGYGNKYDFTAESKGTPGVGQYNLPSIFDNCR